MTTVTNDYERLVLLTLACLLSRPVLAATSAIPKGYEEEVATSAGPRAEKLRIFSRSRSEECGETGSLWLRFERTGRILDELKLPAECTKGTDEEENVGSSTGYSLVAIVPLVREQRAAVIRKSNWAADHESVEHSLYGFACDTLRRLADFPDCDRASVGCLVRSTGDPSSAPETLEYASGDDSGANKEPEAWSRLTWSPAQCAFLSEIPPAFTWTTVDAQNGSSSLLIFQDGTVSERCDSKPSAQKTELKGKISAKDLAELRAAVEASGYCTRKGSDSSAIVMFALNAAPCSRRFTQNHWRQTQSLAKVYKAIEKIKSKLPARNACQPGF